MRNFRGVGLAVLLLWMLAGSAARRLDCQTTGRLGGSAAWRLDAPRWTLDSTEHSDRRALQPPIYRADELPNVSLAVPPALGRAAEPPSRRAVHWYHLGAGLGVVALASLVDDPIEDALQGHRSGGKDDVSRVFRQVGEPEIYGTIGLGTIAVGLISGDDRITRAGARISSSLLVAATTTTILKQVTGRARPNSDEPYRFRPLSGRDSWPSGHVTMAFALAASVSDEIRSTPVTVTLYGAAALTGWSRMNDNRHWLSDVLAGAAVGITSAKLMNGRWRVLGVSGPRFLLEPNAVGVSLGF